CFRERMQNIATATPADLQALAGKWLDEGSHTLVIVPGERTPLPEEPAVDPEPLAIPDVDPQYSTVPSTVDRSAGAPLPESCPELMFPVLQRATLSNGLQIILVECHTVALV